MKSGGLDTSTVCRHYRLARGWLCTGDTLDLHPGDSRSPRLWLFAIFLQENAGIVSPLDYDRFVLNLSQFSIHLSSYNYFTRESQ
jgi:hypothetical protein